MLSGWEKLAREATAKNEAYENHRLRLTAAEVTTRSADARAARIRAAGFPVVKDFDAFDFTARPAVPEQKVLEMARGEWAERHTNGCPIGNAGTGKTHPAPAPGRAVCRPGRRVRFVTAANRVTQLEEAQQQHRLDRVLTQLDRVDLLVIDELGDLSFRRAGAARPFQVFADRYERRSVLVTSNLAFREWGSVFQGDRMTAALLDRLTHRCEIFERNGESYRVRESMQAKTDKDPKKQKDPRKGS